MKTYSMPEVIVGPAPYVHSKETGGRIVWTVTASLLPAAFMGAYYFGAAAVLTLAVCVGSCMLFEFLFLKALDKKSTIADGTAVLTGLLLGMNMPPATPVLVSVLGSFVAIVITKQIFGGLGRNLFNPALMGRAVLMLCFPRIMSTWSPPHALFMPDAVTSATPLVVLKTQGAGALAQAFHGTASLYWHLFIGQRGGCIGETATVALLAGGLFLLYKGYITWQTPVSYLGTVAALAWTFGGGDHPFAGDPIVYLMSGGLVLGAFFMATDYATSPSTAGGQITRGIACGAITTLIRFKGSYPEGVMFSILLMNAFTPLFDMPFKRRTLGGKVPRRTQRPAFSLDKTSPAGNGRFAWLDQVTGTGPFSLLCLALCVCPAVAVTASLKSSLLLSLAVVATQLAGIISLASVRRLIHRWVRVPVFLGVVATIATACAMIEEAFFPAAFSEIKLYVQLIAAMGSLPAGLALLDPKNNAYPVFSNGLLSGLWFLGALAAIGAIRELFGSGSLWGASVWSTAPLPIALLPGGGLLVLGLGLACAVWIKARLTASAGANAGGGTPDA